MKSLFHVKTVGKVSIFQNLWKDMKEFIQVKSPIHAKIAKKPSDTGIPWLFMREFILAKDPICVNIAKNVSDRILNWNNIWRLKRPREHAYEWFIPNQWNVCTSILVRGMHYSYSSFVNKNEYLLHSAYILQDSGSPLLFLTSHLQWLKNTWKYLIF